MTEPFLGQITLTAFGFAPKGYALCDGATLPINQNQALFALLGTTFGGNGQTTFALPDLRGRTPIHVSGSHTQGAAGGAAQHTLTTDEMPAHTHALNASSQPADTQAAGGGVLAQVANRLYSTGGPDATLHAETLGPDGGGQAHPNMQPYLAVSFCIALQGIFPSHQ